MSEYLSGGHPVDSRNNGSRGQVSTGSPSIRGPRDIMRERNAREARRKTEQEALERAHAEEEARLMEDEQKRTLERRAAAAGYGAAVPAPFRESREASEQRISDASQRSERRAEKASSEQRPIRAAEPMLLGRGIGGRMVDGGDAFTTTRPRPSQSQQAPQPSPQARPQGREHRAEQGSDPTVPHGPPPHQGQGEQIQTSAQIRSSFPHAFERWETLSAHWEGLTSFWIRRLEENANETNRDPLSAQLARQVTDLSAAGANLFHAVVELQRLRASSERKFQRWFFDTRAEQERAQELQAITENALREERMIRDRMIAQAVEQALAQQQATAPKPNTDKYLIEMKRELAISKQEARRAWDELGRREATERERTLSLREGNPTLVGGVQVVPMMQGVPSRHESGKEQAQQPTMTAAQESATATYSESVQQQQASIHLNDAYQQYQRSHAEAADPFLTTSGGSNDNRLQTSGLERPGSRTTPSTTTSPPHTPTQAPVVTLAAPSPFYQQQQGTILHPSEPNRGSGDTYSEEEYVIDSQGQFRRDSGGHKIPYQAPAINDESDEEDIAAAREREHAYLQRYGPPSSDVQYGSGPTSAAGRLAPPTSHPATSQSDEPNYEGEGYGSGPGWEAVPRHHHPTRLSDVLEEDERSRTSASQPSASQPSASQPSASQPSASQPSASQPSARH